MEFYYQFLSGKAQRTYRCIEQGIKNQRKNILLLGCFSEPYATELVKLVSYDHPELFYVNYSKLSYLQGTLGFTYQPDYVFPLTQIKSLESTLQIQAEKILEEMKNNQISTPYAKVRWIHNYLIRYVSYDYKSLQNNNPSAHCIQGVLQENSAVCEGIAKTFLYLCDQEQIPAALVVGSADGSEIGVNDDMLHAWNLVSLEGSWFHIDPTFDLCQSQAVKANRYDYFCLSDEEMMRDHIFEKKVECVSNEKSYFCQTRCSIKNSSELRTYALGAFELSQLRAFDDNVDTLYASADATRLHQIIRMAVQSSTLTEVDLYELRLLLPRILPQEQEDEEVAPASAASEKEDDWNEWSERESQRYRQRRRLLEEQHELLHMLQTLQHQHKEEHRPVLLHHRGHGHQR